MKRKALKGMIILLIVLLVCFFFSGTIKTLITAKVKLTFTEEGVLKDQIPLTGYLVFPETERIMADNVPDGVCYTITKVCIHKGSYVEKGDLLFETEIPGIKDLLSAQENNYNDAEKELVDLNRKYSGLLFSYADQRWIDTYDAYLSAVEERHKTLVALEVAAGLMNVKLVEGKIPEDTKEKTLLDAQLIMDEADARAEEAKSAMDKAFRRGISDDVYDYTMQTRTCMKRMNLAHEELVSLQTAYEVIKEVRAPHTGYIVDVFIGLGDQWDGRTAAMTISSENSGCVLRADISHVTRTLNIGLKAMIQTYSGSSIKSYVSDVGYDALGNPTVDIPIEQNDLSRVNTVNKLMRDGTGIDIIYVSDEEMCLLPSSAIRWGESGAYVYIPIEATDFFGSDIYKIKKKTVTVLDEAGGITALSMDTYVGSAVYMEDRDIGDGVEVMEYE